MFVGYPFGKKGWRIFNLDTKEFYISRDVKFLEDICPFRDPKTTNIVPDLIVEVNGEIDLDFDDFMDSETICVPSSITEPGTNSPTY